jgi:hypothetical protein
MSFSSPRLYTGVPPIEPVVYDRAGEPRVGTGLKGPCSTEIDIGLVDHHRDIRMIFEQSGDFRARQRDAGRRVGSGEAPNGLALVLSFTRLAMRGCSPGT